MSRNKLDLVIAQRIKELRLGLDGSKRHSYRALAIKCTGIEDQHTGSHLCQLAQYTLKEEWIDD